MEYSASIVVTLPGAEASRYERLTIRAQTGMNWNNSGYTLEINGAGSWKLYRIGTQIASGTVTKNAEGKYNLKLVGQGDGLALTKDKGTGAASSGATITSRAVGTEVQTVINAAKSLG